MPRGSRPKQSLAYQGTGNPQHKLDEQAVKDIRAIGETGASLPWGWQSRLARKYGVTHACVSQILHGHRWQHVQKEESNGNS